MSTICGLPRSCVTLRPLRSGRTPDRRTNIDTCDGLTNGAKGEIIDFCRDSANNVTGVLVNFPDQDIGKNKRQHYPNILRKYPEHAPTLIAKLEFQYGISKQDSIKATCIQLPLKLCWAVTAHKFQGQTIFKPQKVILDLRKVKEPAQAYVMLSRVQELNQLFILEDLPRSAFKTSGQAIQELERINEISINNNPSKWHINNEKFVKICCLNIRSLPAHFTDLSNDTFIRKSDIICLSETWLQNQSTNLNTFILEGYNNHFNNSGRGKGLAVYFKNNFSVTGVYTREMLQITKVSSGDLDIIAVYRSEGQSKADLANLLQEIIIPSKQTIICGDFNICNKREPNNIVYKKLETLGFKQLINAPTHISGSQIDNLYSNINSKIQETFHSSVYYSDHDAIGVCLDYTDI